jgi:predicted RNA-binding Zn-ribbon protein involved in translation (DUF1610 family)
MVEANAKLMCPQCGSDRLYRDGHRYLSAGQSIQRWLCRSCGYRFSVSNFNDDNTRIIHQLCALLRVKKLDYATETKTVAGEKKAPLDVNGGIVEFLWHMEKENRSKRTIACYGKYLDMLSKIGATLNNPE